MTKDDSDELPSLSLSCLPLRRRAQVPDEMDHERGRRFAAIYEAHGRHLLAWALRRVSRPDAEDLLSETFAVCWRRLDDLPGEEAVRPWLYGVAARLLANQARGNERRQRLARRLEMEQRTTDWRERHATDDVRIERLELAMGTLRDEDAEILRLAAWESLGPSDLAVVLGCSPNAAAIRLHRARRALSQAYQALSSEGGGAA
jgi:RNA polymerase sigma-70 factor (ECF subfamily)